MMFLCQRWFFFLQVSFMKINKKMFYLREIFDNIIHVFTQFDASLLIKVSISFFISLLNSYKNLHIPNFWKVVYHSFHCFNIDNNNKKCFLCSKSAY